MSLNKILEETVHPAYLVDIDTIVDEYPKLKGLSENFIYEYYRGYCDEQMLLEFVTQTISKDKTLSELKKRFNGDYKKAFEGDPNVNALSIVFDNSQQTNISDVNKYMDSFGWYPAYIKDFNKYNAENLKKNIVSGKDIELKYEAKYDVEIDFKGDYLYHVSPDLRFARIGLKGLTPKSASKIAAHPGRIYLFVDNQDLNSEIEALYDKEAPVIQERIKEYKILQIDYKSLRDKIKLFDDPNHPKAVWTYNNIPPKYIKVIDDYFINY